MQLYDRVYIPHEMFNSMTVYIIPDHY